MIHDFLFPFPFSNLTNIITKKQPSMPRNKGTSRKGKPKKTERASGMGRALMRAQTSRPNKISTNDGGMQPAQVAANIGIVQQEHTDRKSVLEMDDMADFMQQAEMANRQFVSEKERFVMVDTAGTLLEMEDEYAEGGGAKTVRFEEEENELGAAIVNHNNTNNSVSDTEFSYDELSVPRRPAWTKDTTAAELDQLEKDTFLEWRRNIAIQEERMTRSQGLHVISSGCVTPFEKNIEVWRQLWRVMEGSSCITLIVDARNPLFYISSDLRKYATENLGKPLLVIVNKSDYLSEWQRRLWQKELCERRGLECVFFSAHIEQMKLDDRALMKGEVLDGDQFQFNDSDVTNDDDNDVRDIADETPAEDNGIIRPLTRQELLDYLDRFAKDNNCEINPRYNRVQFGLVGFPNVGKSSVINVLMGNSKHLHGQVRVGVASQPGKTKHFQTLLLPGQDNMMLCDCPGLVFPSFVNSKADLIAAGVFPIQQMRDFWPVVNLIVERIPREVLNAFYGITLPLPRVWGNQKQAQNINEIKPTGEDLLKTYCISRSLYAAGSGQPHYQQASRVVIRDYVEGKLLFCHPPPSAEEGTLDDNDDDERISLFYTETLHTSLSQTKRLHEKLIVEQKDNDDLQEETLEEEDKKKTENKTNTNTTESLEELLEEDGVLDLLEAMEGLSSGHTNNKKNANRNANTKEKKNRRMKEHQPKKGKRDKDPYGCHPEPFDEGRIGGKATGLIVSAGKYSSGGYTRPDYSGARAAIKYQATHS